MCAKEGGLFSVCECEEDQRVLLSLYAGNTWKLRPFLIFWQHITQRIYTSVYVHTRIKIGHIVCIYGIYTYVCVYICTCICMCVANLPKNEIYEFGDSEPTSLFPNVFSEAIFALLKYKTNCTNMTTGYIGNCTALNIVCVNICQTHTELIHQTNSPHEACCEQAGGFSSIGRGKKGALSLRRATNGIFHVPFSTRRPKVMAEQLFATFIFL